jgi:hypothetical protein
MLKAPEGGREDNMVMEFRWGPEWRLTPDATDGSSPPIFSGAVDSPQADQDQLMEVFCLLLPFTLSNNSLRNPQPPKDSDAYESRREGD